MVKRYNDLRKVFNEQQAKILSKYLKPGICSKEFTGPYVTREKIRELDRIAIEEYGIPGIVLMENAGAAAAREIMQRISCGPVAILCGRGNNGGDGFVIARHLVNNDIPVKMYFIGDLSKVSPTSDSGINLTILKKMDMIPTEIMTKEQFLQHKKQIQNAEIIVDALLGTGLQGPVREPMHGIINEIKQWNKAIAAIDIPSGLDANTGEILGTALPALFTITFAYPKSGFLLKKGPELTGELVVVDISIPISLRRKIMTEHI